MVCVFLCEKYLNSEIYSLKMLFFVKYHDYIYYFQQICFRISIIFLTFAAEI